MVDKALTKLTWIHLPLITLLSKWRWKNINSHNFTCTNQLSSIITIIIIQTHKRVYKRANTLNQQLSILLLMPLQEIIWCASTNMGLSLSRCWIELEAKKHGGLVIELKMKSSYTYKEYLRCSSISMMAAWLPQR